MSTQTHACDSAQAASSPEGRARHPSWTLVATILASTLSFIDGSVVNVALPAIGGDLGGGAAELQWTINAYLLPLSALLLLGGAAGDRFGRKRMLITGIAVFAAASAGCALAPSLAVLLPMRALQGIGAAMLLPNSLSVLGAAFTGGARGRAIGTWAAAGAIASAAGPPLGGWLTETVGWKAIFLINLPVAAAAALLAWRFVDEAEPGDRAMDWLGAALATAGLGLVTWALTLWSADGALGEYWMGVLPGIAVLSCGMALAVAPLTTAVLGAVDERHTGTASGFNSAMARTGGMIATALAGGVIAQSGAALGPAFRAAAWIGAGLALAAGLVALFTLRNNGSKRQ